MEGERNTATIIHDVRNMPGAIIAYTGFGIFLLAVEGTRLPAIQTVGAAQEARFVTGLISFCLLIAFAFLFKKKLDTLRLRALPILITGAVMSASLFFVFRQGIFAELPLITYISDVLLVVCEGILFFFWIKTLYPYGPKMMAISFSFSLFVLATVSFLTTFFKVEAAQGVVMLLPVLSAGCLCYFRDYAKAHSGGTKEHEAIVVEESARQQFLALGDDTKKSYWLSVASLGLSLFCYAFIFGYIHFGWVEFQDGAFVSLAMQLGIAMGSGCAGLLVLLFVRFLWSRINLEIYKLFLIPTIILALWLSTFIDVVWIVFYLILLNITQKLVFLLIVLAPYMIKSRSTVLWPWCIAYLSFAGGRSISSVILGNVSMDVLAVLSVAALIILLFCGVISTLKISEATKQQQAPIVQGAADTDLFDARRFRFQNACRSLSNAYHLTKRESDILALLARGRTAHLIAENLVITPSTAKTHLRNIYAKMGVHNQQEVINLIEKAIENQRKEEEGAAPSKGR